MILSFSGDPFLATRAARRALREQGLAAGDVIEMGEGMEAAAVVQAGSQGGLFGRVGLLLDFDAAFSGKAGTKPRNETLDALASIPDETVVAVLDLSATASRQKRYGELGEHLHLPTPRFGALVQWVRDELRDAGLRFQRDVPDTLVDLFGEDLPGIASEIAKLAVLEEEVDADTVRRISGRLAARGAFDLVDAIAQGDGAAALSICDILAGQGEPAQRVLGAITWQFDVVARCVALAEGRGRVQESEAAKALGLRPFVARKALAIAANLDEDRLRMALGAILRADRNSKAGRDERWALEALALELSAMFAGRGRRAGAR